MKYESKIDGTPPAVTRADYHHRHRSRPRVPDNIPIDHEHILIVTPFSPWHLLKSPSPCVGEVASSQPNTPSIFCLAGSAGRNGGYGGPPAQILDQELTDEFCEAFEKTGALSGEQKIATVQWDGCSKVTTILANGETLESEKVLVAPVECPIWNI